MLSSVPGETEPGLIATPGGLEISGKFFDQPLRQTTEKSLAKNIFNYLI